MKLFFCYLIFLFFFTFFNYSNSMELSKASNVTLRDWVEPKEQFIEIDLQTNKLKTKGSHHEKAKTEGSSSQKHNVQLTFQSTKNFQGDREWGHRQRMFRTGSERYAQEWVRQNTDEEVQQYKMPTNTSGPISSGSHVNGHPTRANRNYRDQQVEQHHTPLHSPSPSVVDVNESISYGCCGKDSSCTIM
ncbi:hypothetical protein Mgra_00008500 [Meloidogyne graminicola]|uniref:Uncharacterized protein n=1 Tax=Meloidogyne graminicola TaxID=189291 RepID=A0A8S9ZFK1_9BILA|nr:hypothetical protein Mgra_00008500 [Meloidogyne graminicola]